MKKIKATKTNKKRPLKGLLRYPELSGYIPSDDKATEGFLASICDKRVPVWIRSTSSCLKVNQTYFVTQIEMEDQKIFQFYDGTCMTIHVNVTGDENAACEDERTVVLKAEKP